MSYATSPKGVKMDFVNEIIVAIDEAGIRQEAYSTINTISLCIALLIGIVNGYKLKVDTLTTIITVLVYYLLSGPIVTAIIFIEDGFWISGRQNGVYIFSYIPLLGYIVSKIIRKSYKEVWDIMMVIPLVMFMGARIACTITGCCRGYPFSWGVYNPVAREILFPIQLLESLASLLILIYVFVREKKRKYVADGKNVPIILIVYGIVRFVLEYLHYEPRAFGFTLMQFHCVFMVFVGLITLRILKRSENKVILNTVTDEQSMSA